MIGETRMATHSATQQREDDVVASPSQDSYEKLLEDVTSEMDAGLSQMSARKRSKAVAEIHAIAENVRLRRAK